MRRFNVGGSIYEEEAPELREALAAAYARHERPLCMCRGDGLPMYIARLGDLYFVKRMPLSGGEHDPSCASHEAPYELSGLGALMGGAINRDPRTGMAQLKLEFSLAKIGARAASTQVGLDADNVSGGTSKKLSLRALLHYLWHEAELTMWTSLWAGKRHWWNVRWHLQEAAKQMIVKGRPLTEVLYIPEPFRVHMKDAIEKRRSAAFAPMRTSAAGRRRLMILVGEAKDIEPARVGQRLLIRHMPGFPFMMDDDLHRRLRRRFERELSLWEADDRSHLIAIATFRLNAAGLAVLEEIAVMVVSENWIPYESVHEQRLVDALARMRNKSIKGLRYNLPSDQPIANAMVQHRGESTALYIVPAGADDSFEITLKEMIAAHPELGVWIWRVGEGEMPALEGWRRVSGS